MKRKLRVLFSVFVSLLVLSTVFVGLSKDDVSYAEGTAAYDSMVMKFSIDFGENYATAGSKIVEYCFAVQKGDDMVTLEAGDVISYEVYSPVGLACGGICAQKFGGDWDSFEKLTSDFDVNPLWGIETNSSAYVKRTVTVQDGAAIAGNKINFWSFYYGTAAAMESRTTDIYYRNFFVYDKDGNVKMTLINNFAQYLYYPEFVDGAHGLGYVQKNGIESASVTLVEDPLAGSKPAGLNQNILKFTVDLGEDYATATGQRCELLLCSPGDGGPALAYGDFFEIEYFSEDVANTEFALNGQYSESWALFNSLSTYREFNQTVSPEWTALAYNPANGSVAGVDTSDGFYTRRVQIRDASIIGKKIYHVSLKFNGHTTHTDRYADIYIKRILVRGMDNSIKYTFFDGTQTESDFFGTPWPWDNTATGTLSIVANPFVPTVSIENSVLTMDYDGHNSAISFATITSSDEFTIAEYGIAYYENGVLVKTFAGDALSNGKFGIAVYGGDGTTEYTSKAYIKYYATDSANPITVFSDTESQSFVVPVI